MNLHDVLIRLAAAVGSGALIGLDRELRRKPAGLRTMALVGLGSAVFTLATIDPAKGSYSDATSRVIQGSSRPRLRLFGSPRAPVLPAVWANWPLVLGGVGLGVLVLVTSPVERVFHNRRKTDQETVNGLPPEH